MREDNLDLQKMSEFGKKVGGILNGAAAALMISIGHKLNYLTRWHSSDQVQLQNS